MNKLILSLLALLLIFSVSAYYPCDIITEEHDFGTEDLSYVILNNQTEINLSIIEYNSTIITVRIPCNIKPQSFEVIFFENEKEIVTNTVHVSSGGGSCLSRTKYLNNTEYIYLEVEKNVVDDITCNNDSYMDLPKEEEVEEKKEISLKKFLFILITAITLFCFILYIVTRRWKNGKRKEKLFSTKQKGYPSFDDSFKH